jgi:hypothetical protein
MGLIRHTLGHALYPAPDGDWEGCGCDRREITHCVICYRALRWPRSHVDTCGRQCFRALLALQRQAPAARTDKTG